VAHLTEGIVLRHPLMLDALLAWAVANQEQVLPPLPGEQHRPVEIPILREPGGRFHLCSQGFAAVECSELRYKNRRAPWHEMARLGTSKITRVHLAAGANKSYRVPYELQLLAGNQIEWWCLGDAERIRELLSMIHYLGKHRGSGKGRLDIHRQAWTVEPCEPWGDGFPVLRDGMPMRPLALDYPGLYGGANREFRTLTFPYFDHTREQEVACP
jgi:hypothetical protein